MITELSISTTTVIDLFGSSLLIYRTEACLFNHKTLGKVRALYDK